MGGDTSQICHLLLVPPPFVIPLSCVKRAKRFLLFELHNNLCLSRVITMMVHIGHDGVHRHGVHLDSGYETVLQVVASHLAIGWEVLRTQHSFLVGPSTCESMGEQQP
jgi:hypothetical protein